MKSLIILLPFAVHALAQTTTTYAGSVLYWLNGEYGTAWPTAATGALATSLADAIYTAEAAIQTEQAYIDAKSAMGSVFDSLTNSADQTLYFLNPGYTAQSWYTASVPSSAQSVLGTILSTLLAVETSVLKETATAATTATTAIVTATTATTANTTTTSPTSSISKAGAQGAQITQMAVAGFAAVLAAGAAVVM